MDSLKYQRSTSLSLTTKNEMEAICNDVLLERTVSVIDSREDNECVEMEEINKICTANIDGESSDNDDYKTKSKTNIVANSPKQVTDYMTNKWLKLLTNSFFWSRIIILLFTLFVMTLCIIYGVAQFVNVELDLVTSCEPKTREEIWEHSYQASIQNDGKLDENAYESQFGHTTEPCWSTRRIEINTHRLWYSNYYVDQWNVSTVNIKFILFVCVALYCLIIIIYNIMNIVIDIIYISKGELHKKSILYKKTTGITGKQWQSHSIWKKGWYNLKGCYTKYMSTDSTGWIIRMFINEIIEIIIQINALLLYNGYNTFDDSNSYLAKKPQFIILFAIFIAINCLSSGILWLLYAISAKCCHGVIFKLAIFCVDQLSDLFYSIFPLIAIIYDQYTDEESRNIRSGNIGILLGQLNTDSALAFLASFIPLILLCNKCVIITMDSTKEMRNKWYRRWKAITDIATISDNNAVQNLTKSQGFNVSTNALNANKQEIFDENGKLMIRVKSVTSIKNSSNWTLTNDKGRSCIKSVVLIIISLLYIATGIIVMYLTINNITESKEYCASIKESNYFINGTYTNNYTLSANERQIFDINPELFLWDKCLYKVHPFTNNKKNRCQCRVFVVENWRELDSSSDDRIKYLNLTQQKIVKGALENFRMLEKFAIEYAEDTHEYEISQSMINAQHLKAFQISFAKTSLPSDISIWKELIYLKLEDTDLTILPKTISHLTEMKYLSIIVSEMSTFPVEICELLHLEVLQLQQTKISEIPHCIEQLVSLKQLLIDESYHLNDIPLSIFYLPNLYDLSLYRSNINYMSLLEYNLPTNIDLNDTVAIDLWLNDAFHFNHNTEYWLQLTPICDESTDLFPSKLQKFMENNATKCDYECVWEFNNAARAVSQFCVPLKLGDGRCDKLCNLGECAYDLGDCVQLCFAKEYTNCSWSLFANDECDEECDNEYCTPYKWKSDFETTFAFETAGGAFSSYSDMHNCAQNSSSFDRSINITYSCAESISFNPFVDTSIKSWEYCSEGWIGDGFCDDFCRTTECVEDLGDCELGCKDDICREMYEAWTLFGDANTYLVSHDVVCNQWLPFALIIAGDKRSINTTNCATLILNTDHNNDKYMNFREFVHFGYLIFVDGFSESNTKSRQMNCSSCIDMEYYNMRYITTNEISASSEMCWSANNWSYAFNQGYIFNAPMDGLISGVRLVHKYGAVTCNKRYTSTKWGCINNRMFVQLVHITDIKTGFGQTYYPRYGITNDTSNVVQAPTDCIHGCEYRYYEMMPYVGPMDTQFSWINPEYHVTMDDQFMLVDGEACCDFMQTNNEGISCAEVYFLYETISIRTTELHIMSTMNETESDDGHRYHGIMWAILSVLNAWKLS